MKRRVICSLDLLGSDSALQALALEAGWDTVVVDEAHHLRWSPAAVSPEYELVRRFAEACPGLLLLTATPEQAGLEGHFSRLRLLDPARFHDYDAFVEAEADYPRLSGLVEALRDTGDRLSPAMKAELSRRLGDIDARIDSVAGRRAIVDELIDRHGTGRVLFRNSRRTVSGFPQRDIQPQAVPGWQRYLADGWQPVEPDDWLYPESSRPDSEWIDWDGRVAWLVGQAASLKGEKLLVICHRAQTAIELDKHLNLRAGIRCTVFHEGMSIVERDRAAAYFAESDAGAQVLVCSEIGSEGRNFQFSRHLVLFDLPLDPDLVEQRIGRLDRIGQGERISIHLPYLAGSAQETLYHWYQRGLDQFARSNGVGYTIYEQLAERLRAVLGLTGEALDELIADTAALVQSIRERQESGRDRLLELNSCDPDHAEQLIRLIEAEEQSPALERYMGRLFDTFGVDHEYHSAQAEILRPGLHMLGEHFPGLEADGMTVTFDRQRALSREDMTFLSWEHPMVVDSMEMVMADGLGGAVVATAAIKQLAPGTMLLEAIYSVAVSAPAELRLERFLGLQPMRFVLGTDGHDVGSGVPDDVLNRLCETVPQGIARNIVERIRAPLEQLIDSANRRAEQKLPEIRTDALDRARSILGAELDRLTALQRLNPSVRDEEIEFIRCQLSESEAGIDRATARLQALRVIVTT